MFGSDCHGAAVGCVFYRVVHKVAEKLLNAQFKGADVNVLVRECRGERDMFAVGEELVNLDCCTNLLADVDVFGCRPIQAGGNGGNIRIRADGRQQFVA